MVIFSGIQPTGRKHLGNYIGAIRQYVEGQDRGDPAIYCIVDLHATTVSYDPEELRRRTRETAALLLAAGLSPDRCILFRQGDVPEHTELTWLLSSVTSVGELQRMHQFRDKSLAQRERVSAGLLYYPVLMAADVLVYRAHEVPVGEDQREHIEIMRRIAENFNRRFGETLVVPEGNIPKVGARILDLQDPSTKMSTSSESAKGRIYVDEEPDSIVKKFKSAQTDSGSEIVRAPDKPGITNLIEILATVRDTSPEDVERDFAGSGYGAFKVAVGEEVADWLAPVRAAYLELRDDVDRIEDILEAGAEKAKAIAAGVVADVREVMGVGPPASRQAARHRLRREEPNGAGAPRLGRSVGPAA
jgi:tryptophanyl-tRNA synthetase